MHSHLRGGTDIRFYMIWCCDRKGCRYRVCIPADPQFRQGTGDGLTCLGVTVRSNCRAGSFTVDPGPVVRRWRADSQSPPFYSGRVGGVFSADEGGWPVYVEA